MNMFMWLASVLGRKSTAASQAATNAESENILAELEQSIDSIVEADKLRDLGNAAAAAIAYGRILDEKPYLTGIRVQYGNMLKDSGQLLAAEAAYRQALAESSDDADIHLQLGHVLKLLGRRPAALAAYRCAAELDPLSASAIRELSSLGHRGALLQVFDVQLRAGGVEKLLILADEIAILRAHLAQLADVLPDARATLAFPIDLWGRFREVFDVPPPPTAPNPVTVLFWSDPETLDLLYAQLAALRSQSHLNWRAVVLGSDASSREIVHRAAASEARISWFETNSMEPPGCVEIRAATMAEGWLVFIGTGITLHSHALGWIFAAYAIGGATAFIFDEEITGLESGRMVRSSPVLRQVVDHDTLLEANVFGETVAIDVDSFRELASQLCTASAATLRSSILLKCKRIGHIPLPLTCRIAAASDAKKSMLQEAHRLALAHHRLSVSASPTSALPLKITVIIPSRDNVSDVRDLTESLQVTASLPNALDILVLDNGGSLDTVRALEVLKQPNLRVVRVDEPFNWSRLNNQAVKLTEAPLLIFANDDMRMLTRGWDNIVRRYLERPEVGAVGVRLLYQDDTLQHAGMLLGWQQAVIHDGLYQPESAPGPLRRWQLPRNVGAVTGAFLATRRDVFYALGGFDEAELPIAYSDVDYALKLRESGMKVLWTPHITLYHRESATRGSDSADIGKAARNDAEYLALKHRWGSALEADPSMHPLWLDATLPFHLISPTSEERINNHIRCCAAAEPWRVKRISKHL